MRLHSLALLLRRSLAKIATTIFSEFCKRKARLRKTFGIPVMRRAGEREVDQLLA